MMHILLYTLFFVGVTLAKIQNNKVSRSIRLDIPGNNIAMFKNQINFNKDSSDQYYYFAIAKDYEWSFITLKAEQRVEKNDMQLEFERVDSVPF